MVDNIRFHVQESWLDNRDLHTTWINLPNGVCIEVDPMALALNALENLPEEVQDSVDRIKAVLTHL